MSQEIPDKYQPKNPDPEVDVAVVPVVKAEIENTESIGADTGLVQVSSRILKEAEALGVRIDGAGAVRAANGFVIMSQESLAIATEKIAAMVLKGEQVHKCAHSLAQLATAMAKCAKEIKTGAPTAQKNKPKRNTGFIPGSAVQVNLHVHGQQEKALTAPSA